jgi:hypothetical protein
MIRRLVVQGRMLVRLGIVLVFVVYVLTVSGGSVMGPFSGNGDCQSYRQALGAGGYCLPLWQ